MQDVLEDSIASISSRQSHDIFGIVSESSVSNPSFRIQRAFDDIYYTFWETVMESPVYVDLSLEKPQMLTCYSLHSGEDKAHQRMPRKWKLLGFTDKVGWKTIDTQVNQRRWRDNEKRTYKISVPEIFDRYKLSIEEVDGDQFLRLYEIKFSTDPMCKKFIP